MPEEQEKFQKNVDDVLEGVMFENWLRFYFLEETEEKDEKGEPKLVMNIPEKGMAKIKELYPRLYTLAEDVNGMPATFDVSRNAVCNYVLTELVKPGDGGASAMSSVIDSRAFQVKNQLFNIWVQGYEESSISSSWNSGSGSSYSVNGSSPIPAGKSGPRLRCPPPPAARPEKNRQTSLPFFL